MIVPWDNAIGPLNLAMNHDFPNTSRKNFPNFYGGRKVSVEEHVAYFFASYSIVSPQHEDVVVRMFIETLLESATY